MRKSVGELALAAGLMLLAGCDSDTTGPSGPDVTEEGDWSGVIEVGDRLSVQSGILRVRVPANTNADATLTVVSGTIASDFPLDQIGLNTRTGTLGAGGPALRMNVISGTLTLASGPPG